MKIEYNDDKDEILIIINKPNLPSDTCKVFTFERDQLDTIFNKNIYERHNNSNQVKINSITSNFGEIGTEVYCDYCKEEVKEGWTLINRKNSNTFIFHDNCSKEFFQKLTDKIRSISDSIVLGNISD